MNFNKKIDQFKYNPKLKVDSSELTESIEVKLDHLETNIDVYYQTRKDEEVVIDKIEYKTSYQGEYLGVLDLYFQLLLNRAVEALDRVSTKELDFFCRIEGATPAFEYYNHEIYNILTIGESLLKQIMPKEEEQIKLLEKDERFFDLPFAQQFEIIEELCSHTFYKDVTFADLELDLIEVNRPRIILSSNKKISTDYLTSLFKQYLIPDDDFTLILQ